MSGRNLPPGCGVSDLPGNRPEDLAYIAGAEAFDAGKPEDANPYQEEHYLHAVWLEGYTEALRESKQQQR